MPNKVPLEILQEQYKMINFSIKEKEHDLQNIPVTQFVLNPKAAILVNELKDLNAQRKVIGDAIKAAEADNE